MTMTSRERFAAMLNHKAPDRMPVYPLVNSISRQSLGITYEEWTKDINKCAGAATAPPPRVAAATAAVSRKVLVRRKIRLPNPLFLSTLDHLDLRI